MSDTLTTQSATPATIPASSIIATDDAGAGGHVQIVKLALSADGSATPITADSNGIEVQGAGTAGSPAGGVVSVQGVASGTALPVSAASLPLPSGAATAANQSTANTALDAIKTAVETLDNFISGSKGLVTEDNSAAILTAVQTIDNFISGSRGLVTEDNSASILTALQTIDNFISGSRGLVTEDNSAAALTALQLIDDVIATLGTTTYTEATTKGAVIAAVRRDADTTLVDTTNEIGPLQMNAAGQLKVEVFSGETLPISAATLPLPSGAATSAKQDTQITAEQAIQTAVEIMDDWDESDRAKVNPIAGQAGVAAGAGNVSALTQRVVIATDQAQLTNALKVDGSAVTQPVSGTVTANLAAGTNTNEMVGDVAHDAAAAGNPVLVAGIAQDMDDTAPPNVVSAESDATRLATDRDGAVFVHTHGPRVWSYHLDTSTAQTDTTVHAAPAAGLSLYVTDIVFSSDGTAAINLFFEEGASKVLGPYYLPATAGGMSKKFATPKKITAATALTLTTSASHAHSVDITGFTGQG